MRRPFIVNIIKSLFSAFKKKSAADYVKSRSEKLSVFTQLQEELEEDNANIRSLIEQKARELSEIKTLIENLEAVKGDNVKTISQISKFL